MTTPALLAGFVRTELLARKEALTLLDVIGHARSREENSCVERARSLLDGS